MKRILFILSLLFLTVSAHTQWREPVKFPRPDSEYNMFKFYQPWAFPNTDSLRRFNTRFITNNAAQAFTNLRLHYLIDGIIDFLDDALAGGGGGGGEYGIDSLSKLNDTTLRYRKNGVFRTLVFKGQTQTLQQVINNDNSLTENSTITLLDSLSILSGKIVLDSLRIRHAPVTADTFNIALIDEQGQLKQWSGNWHDLIGINAATKVYIDSIAALEDTTVIVNVGAEGERISHVQGDSLFFSKINVTGDGSITKNADSSLTINIDGGGDPGGSNTQVQYNDGGAFGGDAGMTYNETANKLTVDSMTALTANIDTARITKRLLVSTDPTVPIGNIMGEFADASDPNVSIYSLTTGNGIPRLYFRSRFSSLANSTDHLAFISAQGSGTSGGSLFFNTTSTAGTLTERMRIDHLGNVGIGAGIAGSRLLHLNQSDAVTNAVSYAFRLSHITSGTATTGFGTGIEWTTENAAGTTVTTGAIDHVYTDATNGSEDMDFVFRTIRAGSITEGFRIKSTGKINLPTAPDSTGSPVGGYMVRDFSTGDIKLFAGPGEYVSAVLPESPIALTSATPANIVSITLTPGDWEVNGNVYYTTALATTTSFTAGSSSVSENIPTLYESADFPYELTNSSAGFSQVIPSRRYNVTVSTTVYLVAQAIFSAGNVNAYGKISARKFK